LKQPAVEHVLVQKVGQVKIGTIEHRDPPWSQLNLQHSTCAASTIAVSTSASARHAPSIVNRLIRLPHRLEDRILPRAAGRSGLMTVNGTTDIVVASPSPDARRSFLWQDRPLVPDVREA
jgi:hypothetical protein